MFRNPWLSNPWLRVAADSWALAMESAGVIAQRSMQIGLNRPGAAKEAYLAITEKIAALGALQMRALTGQLGTTPHGAATKTVALYRRKVKANAARLKRRKK